MDQEAPKDQKPVLEELWVKEEVVVNMKGWIFKDIGFCEKMGEG